MRVSMLLLVALATSGHVGSPDAWYEGSAGPYRVLVHVAAPGVIPGIATVRVRVEGGTPDRVTAVADHVASTGGAPPAEVLAPDEGRPGWYATRLWIMATGSYSVTVDVTGAAGSGTAVVPLGAVASRRLGFGRGLGAMLGAAGIVLVAGLLTIVGAFVREGVVPPGLEPGAPRRRAARVSIARAAFVLALLLLGGWRWWRFEDARFVGSIYRPMSAAAAIRDGAVTLAIRDSSWIMRHDEGWRRARNGAAPPDLLADHGKVMHLFMVERDGRAFAHLHPSTADSIAFASALPPLPPGRYSVFGDLVQTTGFTQTLVASVEVGETKGISTMAADPDDSWLEGVPATGDVASLGDGSSLRRERGDVPLVAGEPVELRFALTTPAGDDAPIEPYMGMSAHAVVVRDDHGVFVHLHPMGTISMAAQARLAERATRSAAEEGRSSTPHTSHETASAVSFPYAFPTSGRYAVWVQVKRRGRVLTSLFPLVVEPRSSQ